LKREFRPEFLNRIDEIVLFDPLTQEQIEEIVDMMMVDVSNRLAERGVTVGLTFAARSWLANEGFDPMFGARPLRRTLQRQVENPLSKSILSGEFIEGCHIIVDVESDGLVFAKSESKEAVEINV
jgi:ATP-dependent Clp protease ATP-binding subunit ClpC